jgi:hypothetical protein
MVPNGHRPLLAPEAYCKTVTKRRIAQAASRIASSRFNHSPIWFQLAKFWLTSSNWLIPKQRDFEPKRDIEPEASRHVEELNPDRLRYG